MGCPTCWGSELGHGCRLLLDVVPDHLALLETLIAEVAWTSHMKARRTASMGVPYNYGGASYPVAPWHPSVARLRDGLPLGFEATNCLLNYYESGRNSMGFHADDVSILEPGTPIAILTLGATRPLRLRSGDAERGFAYEDLPLPGGSLLFMSQQMQAHWRHAMRRVPEAGPRLSLSFRQIVKWPEVPPVVPAR